MKCSNHPDVETNLACSKCGKPICPKCLVMTPVGARCPQCARTSKAPTYRVSGLHYLKAAGACLGAAIVCGFIWGIIELVIPMFSFNLVLAPAAGYAISEAITRSVNRKRGTRLAVIAGIGVIISYLIMTFFPFFHGGFSFGFLNIAYQLAAIALGIYTAVIRLR